MARRPQPWYRKNRGVWCVTINGTRHNLGPDKDEAFRRFYELMRRPAPQQTVSPQSLASIIDAFLDWVHTHRSPDTYEWYRYRLQRFCQRYPDLRTNELRPYHVQQWVDSYSHLSRTSHRNYIRSMKRCLKWAEQQGYLDKNPIALLEVPTADRRDVDIPTEEFETLLSYVRHESFRDLLLTTWETGCRPQELLRVEARHVDLDHQRWVFPRQESKGKRAPRIVYLTNAALAITRRLILKHPQGPLFRNRDGKPWTTFAVNCGFTRLQIRMGKDVLRRRGEAVRAPDVKHCMKKLSRTKTVRGRRVPKTETELQCEAFRKLTNKRATELAPKYSLYALRHAWATRALQSGLDGLTVAILMGHSDPSTLARVYQHLSHNPVHLLEQAKRAAG